MEKKNYIISFGDSRRYRYDGTPEELIKIERELDAYLAGRFPGQSFSYIVVPYMRQLREEELDAYATYPPLDGSAIAEIEEVLAREVQVRAEDRALNNNAPFADA